MPTVALLLLAMSGLAAAAGRDYEKDFRWELWYDQLKPFTAHKYKHDYYYQVPENPRGAVLFAHGCVHSGYNFWPESEACPECRGLPEEMSHTLQALRRGYAVIAISSLDRKTGCFSFWDDCFDVADIVTEWSDEWGLDKLPLYGMGVSAGGAFILKLPRYLKLDGVVSEALGIDPNSGGFRDIPGQYPPAMFLSMQRDDKQKELIKWNQEILRDRKAAAEIIEVYPRLVYPAYFSDRSPYYIDEAFSRKIWNGLLKIGMIDEEGNVLEDPRYTPRPWLKSLQEVVPELRAGKTDSQGEVATPLWPEVTPEVNVAGIWSLMNLAYAAHEIISDYVSVSLIWFESGASEDVQYLQDWYTYGLPPPPSPPPPSPSPPKPRPPPPSPPTPMPPSPQPPAAALPPADATLTASAIPGGQLFGPAPQPATAEPTNNNTESSGMSGSTVAIIAGAAGGAVAVLLVAGLAWFCVRRRRAAGEAAGAGGAPASPTMHAVHMVAGGTAHVSISRAGSLSLLPGAKGKFELAEVVEQTGSPYSARRRMRTAFQTGGTDSPHKADPV